MVMTHGDGHAVGQSAGGGGASVTGVAPRGDAAIGFERPADVKACCDGHDVAQSGRHITRTNGHPTP